MRTFALLTISTAIVLSYGTCAVMIMPGGPYEKQGDFAAVVVGVLVIMLIVGVLVAAVYDFLDSFLRERGREKTGEQT